MLRQKLQQIAHLLPKCTLDIANEMLRLSIMLILIANAAPEVKLIISCSCQRHIVNMP